MKKYARKVLMFSLLIVGISIAGYGAFHIFSATKCKAWPVVKGRIMDSSVSQISDLPNNKTTETSLPDIKYEYFFDGKSHFNSTIGYYGENTLGLTDSYYAGTEDEIAAIIAKYPIDAIVDVYVNPENPAESVLDTGIKLPVFMPFFLGVLFVFAGFHMYLFGNFYIHFSTKLGKLA